MPDMERVVRSLELHVARGGEQRAYIQGKHAGKDRARKEVAWVLVGVFLAYVAFKTWAV